MQRTNKISCVPKKVVVKYVDKLIFSPSNCGVSMERYAYACMCEITAKQWTITVPFILNWSLPRSFNEVSWEFIQQPSKCRARETPGGWTQKLYLGFPRMLDRLLIVQRSWCETVVEAATFSPWEDEIKKRSCCLLLPKPSLVNATGLPPAGGLCGDVGTW